MKREMLFMQIETQRLLIRDIETEDAIPFAIMAADGTLNDCGFDKDCGRWIAKWITEAKEFTLRDDPDRDYLAYTITLKDKAVVVGSVGCSYYEDLQETGITYLSGHSIETMVMPPKRSEPIPNISSNIIMQSESSPL